MAETVLTISKSRLSSLQGELKSALDQTTSQELIDWAGRCGRVAAASTVRRGVNLKNLAIGVRRAAKFEMDRLRASDSAACYAKQRPAELLSAARSAVANSRVVWKALRKYAEANPKEAAIRAGMFCFGFGYASGGLDGDGGLPDLDWELLEEHRSLLTHSILPGILAEVVVAGVVDLVKIIHGKLPNPHDQLWDSIRAGSEELHMLTAGVSVGLAYHLGIDATIDGGGAYADFPTVAPHEAHQATAATMAATEGIDAAKRRPRHPKPRGLLAVSLMGHQAPTEGELYDHLEQTLDEIACRSQLYAACGECRRVVALDVRELIERFGTKTTLGQLRSRLRCSQCGKRPAE
ncbi:MAG TPA: hypothetical protein VF329_15710 [Gammaproteobacteria bacterium]